MQILSAKYANQEQTAVLAQTDTNGECLIDDQNPLWADVLQLNIGVFSVALEIKQEEVRTKRNMLLAATDWAVLPDSPANTPEMLAYRQALRDLPTTCPNPDDVVFPLHYTMITETDY